MKVLEMQVSPCTRKDITNFIEQNHYSQSINGCIADYCFRLDWGGTMIGAMFYGRMAMHNQWKRFSKVATNITELRRLCCINDTPKNTESYFIGNTLRWLRKNTEIERVVSYADAEYGHSGTIYRASNFKYLGLQNGAKVIYWNGKKYHDKTVRTKYNGVLKPFAQKIKDALVTGEAHYQKTAGKHCFIFDLNPKSQTLIKF